MCPEQIELTSEAVRIRITPDFGARITELCDLRTGRNWLVAGPNVGSVDDTAQYGGDEAVGWDECFPTIAPSELPHAQRNHGDLWGRPHACHLEAGRLCSSFRGEGYQFQRSLELRGSTLTARYQVTGEKTLSAALPYVWSQHCLLACRAGEIIELQGLRTPEPSMVAEIADLLVLGPEAGLAQKTYAQVDGQANITIRGIAGTLRMWWDANEIPWCGLWFDYGGWPQDHPVHQIAIEPTTSPVEKPDAAAPSEVVPKLMPGATHHWCVQMKLNAA